MSDFIWLSDRDEVTAGGERRKNSVCQTSVPIWQVESCPALYDHRRQTWHPLTLTPFCHLCPRPQHTMSLSLPPFTANARDRFKFGAVNDFPMDRSIDFFVLNDDFHLIHRSKNVGVFAGTLRNPPLGCQSRVVCKIAYGNALKKVAKEAKIYTKLRDLQRRKVPRSYGLFGCRGESGLLACLMLEYCGEPLKGGFISQPREIKCASSVFPSLFYVLRIRTDYDVVLLD